MSWLETGIEQEVCGKARGRKTAARPWIYRKVFKGTATVERPAEDILHNSYNRLRVVRKEGDSQELKQITFPSPAHYVDSWICVLDEFIYIRACVYISIDTYTDIRKYTLGTHEMYDTCQTFGKLTDSNERLHPIRTNSHPEPHQRMHGHLPWMPWEGSKLMWRRYKQNW